MLVPFGETSRMPQAYGKTVFDNVVTKFEDAQFGAARLFICIRRQIPVRQLN